MSTFHSDRDNYFSFSTPAEFAGALTANEKPIYFNATGQFFSFMAYGAASEFLKPPFIGYEAVRTLRCDRNGYT
jgi:hypothetical protein